jgi:hypothetical protein
MLKARHTNMSWGIRGMLLKFLEGKYLVSTRVEECASLVQEALNEAGLRNVTIKKEVPPRYLLVAYSPGWVGKALEIEFVFKERQDGTGTEISVKWPYTEEVPRADESPAEFRKQEEKRKQITERIIEKFRNKIGAVDISTT